MLGFNPISSFPISAIAPLTVARPKGGAPNYQYPGETEIIGRDGLTALYSEADRTAARARRLQEMRRALGLVPEPAAPEPVAFVPEPDMAALDARAAELADAIARLEGAERTIAELEAAAIAAQRRALIIRQSDEQVLMLLAAVL